MAHYASNKYNYPQQLGILVFLVCIGALIGMFLSVIPLLSIFTIADLKNLGGLTDKLMQPANANIVRAMQTISTLFLFFLPAYLYAWFSHKSASKHLGFSNWPPAKQVAVFIAIMIACLPAVSALETLTEMLPWSKAQLAMFKATEETYIKQVGVIARMNGIGDYTLSIVVIAFLPALFEEVIFRGALQNLLSRWLKAPILAIVITAILFSAVHASYLGFLSRFLLGFILGWVYYKTGNIWLNIIGHFVNNSLGVTVLYFSTKVGEKVNTAAMQDHYPLWLGLVSIALVIVLCKYFETIAQKSIDRPGEEVILPQHNFSNNPFDNDIA